MKKISMVTMVTHLKTWMESSHLLSHGPGSKLRSISKPDLMLGFNGGVNASKDMVTMVNNSFM